jgi:hypothetical protein
VAFNVAIYPTKEELCYIAEEYVKSHHLPFYKKFEDSSRWGSFFNSKLSSDVSNFFIFNIYLGN